MSFEDNEAIAQDIATRYADARLHAQDPYALRCTLSALIVAIETAGMLKAPATAVMRTSVYSEAKALLEAESC